MELIEEVGESPSPPQSCGGGGAGVGHDIRIDVYNRLVENGNEEAVSNPEFRELLDAHFNRLPASYGLDVNIDRAEDVLLHQKLLALAKDPEKRPVFHVRCLEVLGVHGHPYTQCGSASGGKDDCNTQMENGTTPSQSLNFWTKTEDDEDHLAEGVLSISRPSSDANHEGLVHERDDEREFEPCSKLEDLNLEVRQGPVVIDPSSVSPSLLDEVLVPANILSMWTVEKGGSSGRGLYDERSTEVNIPERRSFHIHTPHLPRLAE
ncbi:hypothetical protein Cgig2_004861 [Carnegiea gigantea]|uniref:Uncharacterized protein n=1 Tax=Carnegiea gigantea TaxID=171969 RepID=A0A9Q1QQG8_9CARY|nr:hypothetical protein Cgig2_004861 [Carnegiea gigantea]